MTWAEIHALNAETLHKIRSLKRKGGSLPMAIGQGIKPVMDHYIVKINSGHGAQYAHVEGTEFVAGGIIVEVEVGPFPTAEEAWAAWHKKQGNLKA